jgi:hypothetical protein
MDKMMSPQDDALKIEANERARADTEKQLEKVRSIYKFHFFFTALVFAILSFAIQFPVSSENLWIKIMEVVSWVLIAATALLALKQIGGFAPIDTMEYHQGLNIRWRKVMWFLFFVGVWMLLIAKILNSLLC